MMDDLVDPSKQKMRLEVMALGELGALGRFEFLHGCAIAPRHFSTKRVDRIDEAVAIIPIDLRGGQLLAHGYLYPILPLSTTNKLPAPAQGAQRRCAAWRASRSHSCRFRSR